MYGGGGSPSSSPLPEDSPLVSGGSEVLTSASATDVALGVASNGGAGAKAGKVEESGSVTRALTGRTAFGGGK